MEHQGKYFESMAARWLGARGVRVVEHNYRCRAGEIDLVAIDGNCLVFVEVRSRSNPRFNSAAASVDRRKQLRIIRTAQLFLQRHSKWAKMPCRFDVIAIEPRQSGDDTAVRWIRAAFTQ